MLGSSSSLETWDTESRIRPRRTIIFSRLSCWGGLRILDSPRRKVWALLTCGVTCPPGAAGASDLLCGQPVCCYVGAFRHVGLPGVFLQAGYEHRGEAQGGDRGREQARTGEAEVGVAWGPRVLTRQEPVRGKGQGACPNALLIFVPMSSPVQRRLRTLTLGGG